MRLRICTSVFVALSAGLLSAGAASAQNPPIKIAILDALSGAYATYGQPSIYGANYVFDKVNAEGGLFGRKIEIITEDDGCAPKQAVGGATKLASDPNIVAVFGMTCSGAAGAVRDSVASSAKFPFLSVSGAGWTSSRPDLGGLKPNFFFISSPLHVQAGAMVNFAVSHLKKKRVAFIGQTDVVGKEGLDGAISMLKQYDMELIATETAEARGTDLTPTDSQVEGSQSGYCAVFPL